MHLKSLRHDMISIEPLNLLAERIRSGDSSAEPVIIEVMMPMLWGICNQVGTAYGEHPGNLLSAAGLAVQKSIPYLKKGPTGRWLYYLKKIVMAATISEAKSNLPGRCLSGPTTKIGYCHSLDAEIMHGDEACSTLHDILPHQQPEHRSYDHVHRALAQLKPNQRKVIEVHFGFDGQGERTQEESADVLGCTRANVSLHIIKAIRKLRSLLSDETSTLNNSLRPAA